MALWDGDLSRNPFLGGYTGALDRQRMASTLSQSSGIAGLASLGNLAGLGRLQSGSSAHGLSDSVTFGRPCIYKPKPETIREELQQDTDGWLKDV